MTRFRSLALLVGLLPVVASLPRPSEAAIAERVVAVVGEQAILLSDLRLRARPFLLDIQQRALRPAERAAAESEVFKQLLSKMVDERLEQQQADKARITVTAQEIDTGLRNLASQQGLTVDDLSAEASRVGLSVQDYRDEVRRQILEGKLIQLRLRGRVRVTDEDLLATYTRLVRSERRRLSYRAAWVVLQTPAGLSPADLAERQRLAASIAATARAGRDAHGRPVDFPTLARSFSDDVPTRASGGLLGWHKPGDLAQPIEEEAMKLDLGQVSQPFTYKDAIVIMTIVEREASQLPSLAKARDEVAQRAYGEQMQRALRQWLDDLRRGLYVDIRL